jgi:hypothetical protein
MYSGEDGNLSKNEKRTTASLFDINKKSSYLMNKLNPLDKLGLPLESSDAASSENTSHGNE